MRSGRILGLLAGAAAALGSIGGYAQTAGPNVRVTQDQNSIYVSAHTMGGSGAYTDAVLTRCGMDRRMQNEPTIALDPRNPAVRTAGSNDYCTIPNTGDAWAGFYRSDDSGTTWVDSLLPGYKGDTSPEGTSSPIHAMVAGGALAAGDPVQAWDAQGNLFYMGNNFNRGLPDGNSFRTRDNTGDVWVATYAPIHPADNTTDGQKYLRTVILAQNTFGNGSFNDKTGIGVDPNTGNVYASWSDFHGSGCNQILFSRSTDHGASFSAPMKISNGLCSNQGPNITVAPNGTIYEAWEGGTGGAFGQHSTNGAAFVKSTDGGLTFSKPVLAVTYTPFTSGQFSGSGARDCGDPPFNCPSGQTFPRFDLAGPTITTNGTQVVMAFQVRQPLGQGQIEATHSENGGGSWSSPAAIDPQGTGHQFFPWINASGGRINAVYYDSSGDPNYSPTRAPCNSATGAGAACLNVHYTSSTDAVTWTPAIVVNDTPTNPNYEQFGGRRIPFFGDYIMVSSVGNVIGAVWTDSRNVVPGVDGTGTDMDNDDVAGDPETVGGTCTSSLDACFDGTGGLDQNIYTSTITP
ncbi:MAG: sialidase family protein [Candidatus Dormibacter sp.]